MSDMQETSFRGTRLACYVGYITQAVVNNLAPLLFVIFQKEYGISTFTLGNLILLNFATQLLMDALSVKCIERFGYRRMIVAAHLSAAAGLAALGILPLILPQTAVGLAIAVVLYAFGGGMIEVAVSPVVNALPHPQKAAQMSFLHSFYSWGQVLTVVLTTLLLLWMGANSWFYIPLLWAFIPLLNAVAFARVPFAPMQVTSSEEKSKTVFSKRFLLFMLFMLAAGATELTIAQWASLFVEQALGISKVAGDLLGPCLFAVMMGVGRVWYGWFGERVSMARALAWCGGICVVSYLLVALSPVPWLSLLGCALCGLGVSLMWPGTVSLAAGRFPRGGALLFGTLALCGDAGCSLGPWIASGVAALAEKSAIVTAQWGDVPQIGLKIGILVTAVFPLLLWIGTIGYKRRMCDVIKQET